MNKYIAGMPNEFCGTGVEYFAVQGNKLSGYTNPSLANAFGTEEEVKAFIKENITFDGAKVYSLEPAIKKFDEWIKNGCLYRTMNKKNKELSRKYNNEGPIQVLDWWIKDSLTLGGEVSYEDYETWPDLYEKFKHLKNIQTYHSEKDLLKTAWTVSMQVGKKSKFSDFKKELDLILSRKPTHKTEDGDVIIDIFDHYLSENGNSVSLVCMKNGKFRIDGRYGGEYTDTLENIFEYLKRERWYGD